MRCDTFCFGRSDKFRWVEFRCVMADVVVLGYDKISFGRPDMVRQGMISFDEFR